MSVLRSGVRAVLPAILLAAALRPAHTAATDYRFEPVGKAVPSQGQNLVRVRLVHLPDGHPVADALIFESKADMGPAGMATMDAPVTPKPAGGGIYAFSVAPGMTGTWALHLAAKVQGEPETVRATLDIDLVK